MRWDDLTNEEHMRWAKSEVTQAFVQQLTHASLEELQSMLSCSTWEEHCKKAGIIEGINACIATIQNPPNEEEEVLQGEDSDEPV